LLAEHMNLELINTNSAVALELVSWLAPIENREQAARKRGPWHLWLDKYSFAWAVRCKVAADHWQEQARATDDREQKRVLRARADSIPSGKTAALAVAAASANNGSLAEHCRRTLDWVNALSRQHGDRFGVVELVAESRLLLHLGRANVLENVGLYADRTTGLPLIPGTALKGVVSTWACWAEHFQAADGSFRLFTQESIQRRSFTAAEARMAKRILGDDSVTGSEHAGDVIFVGGFPVTPPKLGLDIVNPHHDSNGQAKAKLTPNTVLCVEPGTFWRFVFFVRSGTSDAAGLRKQTSCWIKEAMTQLGVGAKIAAGYGYFRLPNDADLAAHKKREKQADDDAVAAAVQAKVAAEKAKQQAAVLAALASDYPNDSTFKNRVLDKLNPGQLDQLQPEIPILEKPENTARCQVLKKLLASKDLKDIRKRLRDKTWFPKEWLPPQ
jgi:CRISPR type III-B/RAMP module RAMP protein Cmr6